MTDPPSNPARAVVVGLGNELLTDDGVGPALAALVHARLGPGVALRQEAVGGIELLEILAGFDRAVVIDAIRTEGGRVGALYELDLEATRVPVPTASTHAFGLLEALELGRRLGFLMPRWIRVYAVEVADPLRFGEALTPAVAAALPGLAARIARDVRGGLAGRRRGTSAGLCSWDVRDDGTDATRCVRSLPVQPRAARARPGDRRRALRGR